MSSEMMLGSPPAYKRVDGGEGDCCTRKEREMSLTRTIFALLVVGGLIGMAVMFVGGYYAGRHHGDGDKHHGPPAQYYRMQTADGEYMDAPALQGNQPVEDFLQCRTVTVDGTPKCVTSNPALTPKGTVQFTIYQHGDDVSLVVTGTGAQYGESNSTVSRTARSVTGRRQVTVHATSFRGYMFHPGSDDYHQHVQARRWETESHVTSNLSWNPFDCDSVIFRFNRTQWKKKVGLYFKHNYTGNDIPRATVRAGHNVSSWDMASLPTEGRPFFLSPSPDDVKGDAGKGSIEQPWDTKVNMGDSRLPHGSVFLNSFSDMKSYNSRRSARSLTSEDESQKGAFFKLFDKSNPEKPLSSIRIMQDHRHGGGNGTILFDVTNHTAGCRGQFSMLFHNYLSDGQRLENTSHHQLYMYRHSNATHNSMSMWQAVTPPANPESSRATPLIGKIPSNMDCMSNELGELHKRLQEMKTNPSQGSRQRRHLLWSWNCGVEDTLIDGGECGYHGYTCGRDIFGGDLTFGLSLLKAGKDCYGAISSCGSFIHKCA